MGMDWMLEAVEKAEEDEILVVICAFEVGIFEEKAIIKPKD